MINLEDALRRLREIEQGIDEEALQFARDHWEEALPVLLREIEQAEMVCREDGSYEIALFHVAILLCAEKHEARAFPVLCRRVEGIGDEQIPYGFCAFRLPAALAACCDNTNALMSLFENKLLSEGARECAFHALVHLSRSGHWEKEEFDAWFTDLLRLRVNGFPPMLGSRLIMSGIDLLPEVVRAISKSYIEKYKDDEVVDVLLHALNLENPELFRLLSETRYRPIGLASEELDRLLDENFPVDEYAEIASLVNDPEHLLEILSGEEEEKVFLKLDSIGRNDRCPCGSGKKFKKCCAGKDVVQVVATRVGLAGTLVRKEDQLISDLMAAGYVHEEMGDRPAQLASWMLCVSELQARLPESANDPDTVERKNLFVGHNPLGEWLDDFCLLVFYMFLDRDTTFMLAQPHIDWLASQFTGANPIVRNSILTAHGLVRYLDKNIPAAIADLRKAIGICPEAVNSRCIFAQFSTNLGAEGVGEAKQVLREGIALNSHPSLEELLKSIEKDFPDRN